MNKRLEDVKGYIEKLVRKAVSRGLSPVKWVCGTVSYSFLNWLFYTNLFELGVPERCIYRVLEKTLYLEALKVETDEWTDGVCLLCEKREK